MSRRIRPPANRNGPVGTTLGVAGILAAIGIGVVYYRMSKM